MSAAALIPSLIPLCVVMAMRRAEASIHRQLVNAGAVTAESAIPLLTGRAFEKRRLEGLLRGGAVRPAANGRHFLDVDGWRAFQQGRRRRGLLAVAVVVALIGIAAAIAVLVANR